MNAPKLTSIVIPKFTHTKEREAKFSPFFKVKEVPLIREDNKEKVDLRALINADTDKKVGVVSDRYNLVTHKYASDVVKSILTKAGLEYESLGAQTSNGGSRFFETLTLPSLGFDPQTPDVPSTAFDALGMGHEKVEMHFPAITIMNSYDKTCPVVVSYGMYRLICTNGLALPLKATTVISFKHTQEIDVDRIKEVLMTNLEESKILMNTVYKKLNSMNGTQFLLDVFSGGFSNKFKKTLLDKLNEQDKSVHFDYEEKTDAETGRIVSLDLKGVTTKASAYAVYNVITDIASHTLTNRSERETANKKIANLFVTADMVN